MRRIKTKVGLGSRGEQWRLNFHWESCWGKCWRRGNFSRSVLGKRGVGTMTSFGCVGQCQIRFVFLQGDAMVIVMTREGKGKEKN